MSLSVTAVLEAAARSTPDRVVPLPGAPTTCRALEARACRRSQVLLDAGSRPGGRLRLPDLETHDGLVTALAAARIGLVLAPDTGAPEPDDRAGVGPAPEEAVAASTVWSQTPVAEVDGGPATHADLLAWARDGGGPAWLGPLVSLLMALTRAG